MKKIISLLTIILFVVVLLSCSKNQYGYIKDKTTNLPIEGVLVVDTKDKDIFTYTDKEGMFSFLNCGNLIILKEGYKSDTLKKYGCRPTGKCFNGHIFYMTSIKK